MKEDKKVEQLISLGVKRISMSKKEYENLKQETKNLIKLNNIKIDLEDKKKC
ncbi:MAG: hypothetical protein KIC54_01290 [Clostridium sp.]|nr:hypothetical protein [Clostridium sp.]